ncbi:MAG: hypothetical protein BJ554DRAFT_6363, partial [Olpidium bornovanus]
ADNQRLRREKWETRKTLETLCKRGGAPSRERASLPFFSITPPPPTDPSLLLPAPRERSICNPGFRGCARQGVTKLYGGSNWRPFTEIDVRPSAPKNKRHWPPA